MKNIMELYEDAKHVSITAEIIQPEYASTMLKSNTDNFRNLRPGTVSKYARDMDGGGWVLSWDCIAFAEDGTLLNGQHRLESIVKSKKPQVCFIMHNCSKESFNGDTGLKRSMHDLAKQAMEFEDETIISTASIGALKCLIKHSTNSRIANPTLYELLQMIMIMPFSDVYVQIVKTIKRAPRGVGNSAVMAALYCAFANTEDEKVLTFAEKLVTGVGSEQLVRLRDKLRDMRGDTGLYQERKMLLVERGVDAYLKGETLSKFYIPEKHIYTLSKIIDF